jgi:hypothetical protein
MYIINIDIKLFMKYAASSFAHPAMSIDVSRHDVI